MKENYGAVNMMILQEKGYFGHDDASLIVDGDPHFIINPISREIVNNSKKTDLIQFDHNSERITFECPHFIEGHDMTFCNKVVIDYSVGESKGVYEVNDLAVKKDDSNTVVFTWLISSNVTTTLGKIKFALTFKCVLSDGTVTYKWGTKRNDTLQCLETEQGNAWVAYDYPDILEQWKTIIFDAKDNSVKDIVSSTNNGIAKITSEGKSQVQAINTAGITVKNDIEKKATDTLATIPEDYTHLDNDVGVLKSENVRYSARFGNALIKKVTGDKSVTITDSAEAVFRDLKISGKSEQVQTTGTQLLPQPQFNDTKNGITVKTQTDGGISITGTATAAITFTVAEILLHAGKYTLSGLSGLVVGRMYFQLVEISAQGGQFVAELAKVGHVTSTTVTIDRDVWARAEIKVLSGVTADSICYPMLNFGDTALPWEPYTGGAPSPSPDYPQDIISVGTVSTGKQIFFKALVTLQGTGAEADITDKRAIKITYTRANGGKYAGFIVDDKSNIVGKTLTISYGSIMPSKSDLTPGIRLYWIDNNGYVLSSAVYANKSPTTITIEDPQNDRVTKLALLLYADIGDTAVLNDYVIYKDIMINAGDTALPWEPYTGGKPSPSVEYPAELEVGVTGAQLLNADTIVQGMVNAETGALSVTSSFVSSDYVPIEPGDYVLSGEGIKPYLNYVVFFDKEKVIQGNSTIKATNGKFTVTEGIAYARFRFVAKAGAEGTVTPSEVSALKPMLNAGDTALPWEPYNGHQTATITLTEPLRAGDWIMYRDGVWGIERWGIKLIADGNEDWTIYDNSSYISFYTKSSFLPVPMNKREGLCKQLRVMTVGGRNLNSIWLGANNKVLYAIDNQFYDNTLEDKGLANWKAYLAEFPLEIITYLDAPTWEPLPFATQQALNELTTYAGTTHLTITAGGPVAGIKAEYVQDINGVIAELLRQIEELRNAHTK